MRAPERVRQRFAWRRVSVRVCCRGWHASLNMENPMKTIAHRALLSAFVSSLMFAGLAYAQTPPVPGHPRVAIWGLLEARLLDADHIVLGGLNETVWPPQTTTDSFINRPMRAELGLSPPERRVGQTAHDFVMAALAPPSSRRG